MSSGLENIYVIQLNSSLKKKQTNKLSSSISLRVKQQTKRVCKYFFHCQILRFAAKKDAVFFYLFLLVSLSVRMKKKQERKCRYLQYNKFKNYSFNPIIIKQYAIFLRLGCNFICNGLLRFPLTKNVIVYFVVAFGGVVFSIFNQN